MGIVARTLGVSLILMIVGAAPLRAREGPSTTAMRKAYRKAATALVIARELRRKNGPLLATGKELVAKFEAQRNQAQANLDKALSTPRQGLDSGQRKKLAALVKLCRAQLKNVEKLHKVALLAREKVEESLEEATADAIKYKTEAERLESDYLSATGEPLPEASSLLQDLAALCDEARNLKERYDKQAAAVDRLRKKLERQSEQSVRGKTRGDAIKITRRELGEAISAGNQIKEDFDTVTRKWSKLAQKGWWEKDPGIKRLNAK